MTTPFVIAVPNVKNPPAVDSNRFSISGKKRHTSAKHAYLYTAVVEFAGGLVVEVPAGYTTFHLPASRVEATSTVANVTFDDRDCSLSQDLLRCLPEDQRSKFSAQVFLDSGDAVEQGPNLFYSSAVLAHTLNI